MWATHEDVRRHAQLAEEWKAAHRGDVCSLADLMEYPAPVHWWVTCWTCRTADEANAYWFELPADHARWLEWAAHLIGKSWVADSDLDDLLREVARNEHRFAA